MPEQHSLTFLVWADTHFGYEQRFGAEDIRHRALDQTNRLAGWPYPLELGGCVGDPSLLLVCGDFVDGGPDGERNFAYYRNALRQTAIPSYEAIGNHDIQHQCVLDYITDKHGGPHYSFECQGVHFVSLCQTFDQAEQVEALDDAQLRWLEDDLHSLTDGTPVVVFAHDALDKQTNADAIAAVLGKANVVLCLSGHLHGRDIRGGCVHNWNGITMASTGHVRNHPIDMIYGRVFLVVRMTPADITIAPWRWDLAEWASHQADGGRPEHVVIPLN